MRWYFLIFGICNLVALGVAFLLSLHVLEEYFSYFTVLSNILITVVFLYFGLTKTKNPLQSKFIKLFYGPAVLYMTITGIVYWTILHGGKQLTTDVEWITLVLHGLMPLAVILGWVLRPYKKYTLESIGFWLVFPVIFVCYTLLHGPFIHWYPYPFLDPLVVGYKGVVLWSCGILGGSFVVSLGLLQFTRISRFKLR